MHTFITISTTGDPVHPLFVAEVLDYLGSFYRSVDDCPPITALINPQANSVLIAMDESSEVIRWRWDFARNAYGWEVLP